MKPVYQEVPIPANTPEWLEFRRGKITASKMPIIMGLSPYMTPYQLWQQEVWGGETKSEPHMQRGLDIENDAREHFHKVTGIFVKPVVILSGLNPEFMASIDGMNEESTIILEIKNNNVTYHGFAKNDSPIEFHVCQMQFQMYVAGATKCYYLSYRKGDEVICIVKRDDDYIGKLIDKGREFREMVRTLTPPPLEDRDYVDMQHVDELFELSRTYKDYLNIVKEAELVCEKTRKRIIEISNNKNIRGPGFKLTKYAQKGHVQYANIPELKDVDLDSYRNPPIMCSKITLDK